MSLTTVHPADTDAPILDVLAERWSTRIFDAETPIDEAALATAIAEGRVAGAGIDVFASEPCTDSPLFEHESVVVTPHLGASTEEAQEKAGVAVARSVRLALSGDLVPDAVNVSGGAVAEEVRPGIDLVEKLGRIFTAIAGAVPVMVPLTSDARHDLPAMADAITERARLVLVCTPNNPTGPAVTAAELEAFLARVPDDVLVVIDEAYVEYAQRASATTLLAAHANLAVLRHIGDIREAAFDRDASWAAEGERYIFDLKGSKGAGRLEAEFITVDADSERIGEGELDQQIVVNTGDPFAGLWYTVGVVAMAFLVTLIWLPETRHRDIH